MNLAGELIVFETAQDLAQHVAGWLADRIAAATPPVRIALSGGSTPRTLFQLLASEAWRRRIDWNRTRLYWGDERFVSWDDPSSNYRMTREALLDHIEIAPEHVFPMPVWGAPDDAALRYERLLQSHYGAETLDPGR